MSVSKCKDICYQIGDYIYTNLINSSEILDPELFKFVIGTFIYLEYFPYNAES